MADRLSEVNQAFINSQIPVAVYALCVEKLVGFNETADPNEQIQRFSKFKSK